MEYNPVQKLSTILEESDMGHSAPDATPRSSREPTPPSTTRQKRMAEKNGDSIPVPALPANDSGHSPSPSSSSPASSTAGAILAPAAASNGASMSSTSPADSIASNASDASSSNSSNSPTMAYHPLPVWPEARLMASQALPENVAKTKFVRMVQIAHQFRQQHRDSVEIDLVLDHQGNVHLVRLWSHGSMQSHAFEGNAQYIAPELALHRAIYGETADVWVLGISLYRMLVGKYPFHASNDRRLFNKMHHGGFTIPSSLSDDARDLLQRMLAPDRTRASLDLVVFHPWLKTQFMTFSSMLDTGFASMDASFSSVAPSSAPPASPTSTTRTSPHASRRWSSLGSFLLPWTAASSDALKIEHDPTSVQHQEHRRGRKRPSSAVATSLSPSPLPKRILVLLIRGPYPPPCRPYRDLSAHPTTSLLYP
ncbi:kinase-like domain-containing protein [Gongronella butleri]|nr:kinase-like domain-containing protein [Gongronella butleri]